MADDVVTGTSGHAEFGVKARFRDTISKGHLVFKFSGINLMSTSIDWLVIVGSDIQIEGQGTLDNIGGYYFRVTARDNDEPGTGNDVFGIKIWDGNPDDTATTLIHSSSNVLSGGNIVIHKDQNDIVNAH